MPPGLALNFQVLFEQSPTAFLVLIPNAAFTIVAVTDAYLQATLRRRDELVGKGLFEAFPDNPDDRDASGTQNLRASLLRVLSTRVPDAMPVQKYDIIRPDGTFEERHWTPLNSPVLGQDGNVLYLLHQVEDVTPLMQLSQRGAADRAELVSLRKAETVGAELRRKEAYLRRVLEANQVGTWELDLGTKRVEADERLCELFFLSGNCGELGAFLERINPEDLARTNLAISNAVEGKDGGRYLVEYRVVEPTTRRVRWLEARGQAYFDAQGHAERFFGTVLDITERKVAELTREGLLEALSAQPVVFFALLRGPELVFEFTNPPYEKLLRGQQLVGRPFLDAIPEVRGQGLDALMHEAMASGKPYVGHEMVVPLARGETGALEDAVFNFVYQPVRGAEGTYDGVLIMGVEVTQEVRTRKEAEARLAFEERLTGIVGHDLRSPLAALKMSASQLMAGGQHAIGLTPGQVRIVERVARGTERIQSVISSLLDLTRARGERGFPIQPIEADLDATVRTVLDELRTTHPERTIRYEKTNETRGLFDPERIAQVVANLLENAFKYGDPGAPVTLQCGKTNTCLRLSVHNEGAPIAAELRARLFEPFARGAQPMETVKVSMGLGLYIVREIVRAHGGHVVVDSHAKTGTAFAVELPLGREPPRLN